MKRALRALRGRAVGLGAAAAAGVLALTLTTVPSASGAFLARITDGNDTVGTANYFKCQDAIAPDLSSAYLEWPLQDGSGSTAADSSGNNRTGTYVGTTVFDSSAPLGCPRDGGTRWRLDGSTNYAYSPTSVTGPQVFTIEVTFQTSAKQGKLIGFGNSITGASSSYDRHLYINTSGRLVFGIYSSGYHVVTSPSAVTDGAWHHAAATLSSAGMKLYLDGTLVASDASSTAAEPVSGYWHVGYDNVSGWPGAPSSGFFNGRIMNAGIYTVELSAQQIANHAAPTFGTAP